MPYSYKGGRSQCLRVLGIHSDWNKGLIFTNLRIKDFSKPKNLSAPMRTLLIGNSSKNFDALHTEHYTQQHVGNLRAKHHSLPHTNKKVQHLNLSFSLALLALREKQQTSTLQITKRIQNNQTCLPIAIEMTRHNTSSNNQ